MNRDCLTSQLRDYVPTNEQESRDREILLWWLDSGVDIITRENPVAHLTASAWVLNQEGAKVLMAYHKLYDSWAWLGGHADGDWDLAAVAAREAREESGIQMLSQVGEGPASLEILTVDGHEKRGRYISSHLHLNVTYLFRAEEDQPLSVKEDENSGVAWIPLEQVGIKSTEPWFVERIYSKLIKKASYLEE